MLGLEVAHPLEQLGIALDDLGVGAAPYREDLLAFFELQGEFARPGSSAWRLFRVPAGPARSWGGGRLERFGVGRETGRATRQHLSPGCILHARHRKSPIGRPLRPLEHYQRLLLRLPLASALMVCPPLLVSQTATPFSLSSSPSKLEQDRADAVRAFRYASIPVLVDALLMATDDRGRGRPSLVGRSCVRLHGRFLARPLPFRLLHLCAGGDFGLLLNQFDGTA